MMRIQNHAFIPVFVLVIALVNNLELANGQVRGRRPTSSRPVSVRTPSLYDEAQEHAGKYWRNKYRQCKDSHFSLWYYPENPNVSGGYRSISLVEARGLRWDVNGQAVIPRTEAERLNQRDNPTGIQWEGRTSVYFTAWRFYTSRGSVMENRGWNKWKDNTQAYQTLRLAKQNGRWIIFTDDTDRWRPVDCSKIPGISSSESETIEYAANYVDYSSNEPTNIIYPYLHQGIKITSLIFCETGASYNNPTICEKRFPRATSRFINYVLRTEKTARYAYNPLRAIWYKVNPNGSLHKFDWSEQTGGDIRQDESSWAYVSGKGYAEPGKWDVGSYKVKIFERGKLVAIGEFEIY